MNKPTFLDTCWVRSIFCKNDITQQPFQHIFRDHFFSKSCFDTLKSNFVEAGLVNENNISREKKENRLVGRDSYFLCPELLEKMKCIETQNFWKKFITNFKSSLPETKAYLLNEFQRAGLATEYSTDNLSIGFRFVTETLPFDLAPHMDMPQKIAVCVVYVSTSGQIEHGGTHLYKKNHDTSFKEEVCYDFIENNLVLIPRVLDSWHGGTWRGQGTRKTFHIYFFSHPTNSIKSLRNRFSFLM
ncbi:MAG: hypothetical protein HRU35_07585 [Rickettsiaceae bacterium]|nr:hypothetical protein [Rickettsiaceae bacterium]